MSIDKYKKLTTSALKKKLDKLWKEAILKRDKYCKACELEGVKKLSEQAHHIIHRSQSRRGKWDLANGIGLCSRHHFLIHLHKMSLNMQVRLVEAAFGSLKNYSKHEAEMKEPALYKKHDLIEMIEKLETKEAKK